MGAFVRFDQVKKTYRMGEVEIQALRDATFSVERGVLCVIVGPSGAGETTLLNILGGMDTLTEGKVFLGGEEISARALYQSAITFKPQFTLWLSCNDLPMVTDKSLFASERIKVVEFNRHFSPEEQDTHLKDELCEQASMSGIFMWLVRGYIRYKERGLTMSGQLREVVTKYERDNDLVLQFLENRCVKDETATIRAKDLYQNFKMWAKSEGAYVLSARKFNSEMERHPEWFERKSTSSGFVIYWGLKLKEVI